MASAAEMVRAGVPDVQWYALAQVSAMLDERTAAGVLRAFMAGQQTAGQYVEQTDLQTRQALVFAMALYGVDPSEELVNGAVPGTGTVWGGRGSDGDDRPF